MKPTRTILIPLALAGLFCGCSSRPTTEAWDRMVKDRAILTYEYNWGYQVTTNMETNQMLLGQAENNFYNSESNLWVSEGRPK